MYHSFAPTRVTDLKVGSEIYMGNGMSPVKVVRVVVQEQTHLTYVTGFGFEYTRQYHNNLCVWAQHTK